MPDSRDSSYGLLRQCGCGVDDQVGAVGEKMGFSHSSGVTSSDRELPILRGINHGEQRGLFSQSLGWWDRLSYIPQYFDDGVALTCEYLAEGVEFSYSALKKTLLASLALNFFLIHTRHKGASFMEGDVPSQLVGLWQIPVLVRLKKRGKIYSQP